MYRIKLTAQVRKELKNLKKIYQDGVKATIEEIKENPFIGKPLSKELFGKYSYRVGPYRIIHSINKKDNLINILTAGHRSIVYL